MSHLNLVRLSKHWIKMTFSSSEYQGEPPKKYKIKVMKKIMPVPSDYGKNPQPTKTKLRSKGLQICDHHDGDYDNGVTQHYQGFQTFIEQCNITTLNNTDTNDNHVRNEMCREMSRYFPNEKERQGTFIRLMNDYMRKDNCVMETGESSTRYDGYIDPDKCVILEVKKESSDSYAQVIAYYVHSLEDKLVDQCPVPAFLLELVGPHLFISGAVYDKYVCVDRLVDSVWLVPHQREEAMIRITQIFKALKDAIIAIKSYYKQKGT